MIKKLFFFLLLSIVSVSCFSQQDTVTLPNGQKLIPKNPNNYPSAVYNDSLKVIAHNAVVNGKRVNLQLRAGDIKDAAVNAATAATASAIASKASQTSLSDTALQLRSDFASKSQLTATNLVAKDKIISSTAVVMTFSDLTPKPIAYYMSDLATSPRYANDGWHILNFFHQYEATSLTTINTDVGLQVTGLPLSSDYYTGVIPTSYNHWTVVKNGESLIILVVNRQIMTYYESQRYDMLTDKAVNILRDSLILTRSSLTTETNARIAADNAINTTLSTRASQTSLNALTYEVYAKADTAALTSETNARIAADALKADQAALDTEGAARVAGDANINSILGAKSDTINDIWKLKSFAHSYYTTKDSTKTILQKYYKTTFDNFFVYVDQITGDDTKDGLSAITAVKTVEKAILIANSMSQEWGYVQVLNSSATNRAQWGATNVTNRKVIYFYCGFTNIVNPVTIGAPITIRGDLTMSSSILTAIQFEQSTDVMFTNSTFTFTANNQTLFGTIGSSFQRGFADITTRTLTVNDDGFTGLKMCNVSSSNTLYRYNFVLQDLTNIPTSVSFKFAEKVFYAVSNSLVDTNKTRTEYMNCIVFKNAVKDSFNTVGDNTKLFSFTANGSPKYITASKSKTLTLTTSSTPALDFESGIQVTYVITTQQNGDFFASSTVTNVRDGGIYRIRFVASNTGVVYTFPSNVYKKDGTPMGAYAVTSETLIFHAEGANLYCENK